MNEDILEIAQFLEIASLTVFISVLIFLPMWGNEPRDRRHYTRLLIAAFFILVVSFFILKMSPE